jgi:phosphate transport system substrate-binding protein
MVTPSIKLTRGLLTLAAVGLALVAAGAQERGAAEAYYPEQQVSGVLRLWGHGSPETDFMGKLVRAWQEGFRRYQAGIEFDNRMYGTASAIGALYADAGDVAILGREVRPFELSTFERVKGYPPLGIDIATGSLDVRNFDFALVVFVHKDNPISRLTLAELDAIFGCEHRRGTRNFRTWSALGLTGAWADRPIHAYGSRISGGFAVFFQDAVLQGSGRWNAELKEFFDVRLADGSLIDSGQQVLDAIGNDRDGIGVSSLHYTNPRVKPLALAFDEASHAYEATRETLVERTYPLTRVIPAFINRVPGKPVDPRVKEFLRYILSREGQQDIVRDGRYLPLSAAAVREQLSKLK